MRPKSPLHDLASNQNRGVSSVIGVVLMVAAVVVLAATVGVYVFGMTGQIGEPAPSATFDTTIQTVTVFDGGRIHTAMAVVVHHEGGEAIDADNLRVTVNGERAWDVGGFGGTRGATLDPLADVGTVEAGKSFRVVLWENKYGGYPVADGNLDVRFSGGCGTVFIDLDASDDCAMANDELAEGDTVRVVYESSGWGMTSVVYEETI